MNIYVSNLSFNVADEDLHDFFAEYGEVTSAKVIKDKFTGRSRGFGFVEMSNDENGQKAITELDGAVVEGRSISVTVAKPKEERSDNRRSFSNSGNNGGGGGYNNRY
ncbi:MAG: RNA-binding protein [Chitinophagaceae bacterium]|nr:RNA-binding protein [Chitinophagaceae bacterium]